MAEMLCLNTQHLNFTLNSQTNMSTRADRVRHSFKSLYALILLNAKYMPLILKCATLCTGLNSCQSNFSTKWK